MRVWTVANQKGGVGKTTTAVALGGLANEQGLRVLLVDLDPHGSLTSYFKLDPDSIELSTQTLFANKSQMNTDLVKRVIAKTPYDNLFFIPASTALATLERKAIGPDGMGLVISKALAAVRNDFDIAIVDCPPQLGVLMVNALAACDHLIIPVQTEFLAIKGLERMIHTLNMLTKSLKKSIPYSVVPTMFDRRTQASVSSLRMLRNNFSEHLWLGRIPVDTKFRDASKAGIPPHLFSTDSRGVDGYRSFLNQSGLLNNSHLQMARL